MLQIGLHLKVLFLLFFLVKKIKNNVITPMHDYCSITEFEKCLSIIDKVSQNENLSFATTITQLNESCRMLNKGLQCTDEHMARCTSRNRFADFETIVIGTRKVIERLCQPGQVQIDYLRHSACYKKVFFKYVNREAECNYWIKSLMSLQKKPANLFDTIEEQQKELQKFCCVYNKSLKCQRDLIKFHCDEDALEFFNIHSNTMSEKLIQEHCSAFNEENEKFCKYIPVSTKKINNKQSISKGEDLNLNFKIYFLFIILSYFYLKIRFI